MNRTFLFLASAAALLILAVVFGRPLGTTAPPPPVEPPPEVKTPPVPPPPPAKVGSLSMTGRLSHPWVLPGTHDVFATLEVAAVDVPGSRRAPVNLSVVIDRSGSMQGAKIQQARRAASRLVDLLDEHDRLAIVHYGTDVEVLPGVFATPENKARMQRFIARISEAGGTNIGDGLAAGQAQLEKAKSDFRVNRLLLLSDGQPTVGVTSPTGLASIVRRIREGGITVTSLGVGADFNEDLMQRLADVGGGSYGFISDAAATAELFQRDLQQASTMVANGTQLSFTLPPGVRLAQVFGRSHTQRDDTVTVALPDFSARQVEKVVVQLTVTPSAASESVDIGQFQLTYQDLLTERPADARVALAAFVTEDRTLAFAKRDKDATVTANKARAAVNYDLAARAIERGDFGGAEQALKKNEALFVEGEAVGGSMAEDRATNQGLFGLSSSAPAAAPAVRREAVKAMKSESLKSSGRGASVY